MSNKKEVAVEVCNIHKDFILPQNKNSTFKQTVVNIVKKNNKITQKVLDGVSFEVNKGDFFGIVGRNGCGKSTLLKLIAGVYTPTSGHIKINGGLTPFIELGVGFNPELSGRDNVYLNGALLGFNRKQMDVMYEDIVSFAELGPFMDQKLKNYSSGMQVRLAFSIAIKAKNEILIFDEVLAVGDEAFQQKCLNVFEKYKAEKQTVILVTHDMSTVKKFCNRAILVNDGKIVKDGNPRSVADAYSGLNQDSIDNEIASFDNNLQNGSKFLKAEILNINCEKKQSFTVGERAIFRLSWPTSYVNNIESMGVNIFKLSGEHITGFNTRFGKNIDDWRKKDFIDIEVELNITPGSYYLLVEAFKKEGVVDDSIVDGPKFIVKNQSMEWSGLTNLNHVWKK